MIRPAHGILVFLSGLLLWGLLDAGALAAQELREGSLVRVQRYQAPSLTGRLEVLSTDTLWLRIDRVPRPVARSSIRRLEQQQRETRMRSGWTWAKRGLMVGAVLGGVTCMVDQENCTSGLGPDDGLTEGFLAASMFYGGGVGFVAFVGGTAFPGHRWVEIPLPREPGRRD